MNKQHGMRLNDLAVYTHPLFRRSRAAESL